MHHLRARILHADAIETWNHGELRLGVPVVPREMRYISECTLVHYVDPCAVEEW